MSAGFRQGSKEPHPRKYAVLASSAMRFEGSFTMADVAYAPLQESIPFEKRAAEAGLVSFFQYTGVGTLRT